MRLPSVPTKITNHLHPWRGQPFFGARGQLVNREDSISCGSDLRCRSSFGPNFFTILDLPPKNSFLLRLFYFGLSTTSRSPREAIILLALELILAIARNPIEIANNSIAIASHSPEIAPHWSEIDGDGFEIDRYKAEIDSNAPEIAAH
jgi:hypothetical protein